jgi:curved DNA-binding protein CbpA
MQNQLQSEHAHVTCYEVLQLHPAAPLELVTAAYWRLAGEAQSRRGSDPLAEADLHRLTNAYQTLTDSELRAEYDRSLGLPEYPQAFVVPRAARKGLFLRKRENAHPRVDHYDVLCILPSADKSVVEEAYTVLRSHYSRLVRTGYTGPELLDYLEEAYAVASNQERRSAYDGQRGTRPSASIDADAPNPARVTGSEPTSAGQGSELRQSLAMRDSPAVTSLAGGAIAAMSRQLTNMSRRERQQVEERLAERVPVEEESSDDVERALLQRISSTVEPTLASSHEGRNGPPLARLTVVEGPNGGASFDLRDFPLTLGADDDCEIRLEGLAPRHARLLHRDGHFVVYYLVAPAEDENQESEAWWILESGEDLTLGPYRLRFNVTQD